MRVSKKSFLIINLVLFLMEVVLIYFMINAFLSNDILSPREISFYEYLKFTIQNLV